MDLGTELIKINNIAPRFVSKLSKLKINTVKDLLWHFPFRYDDFSKIIPIAELVPNQPATIQGIVQKIGLRRTFKKHLVLVEAIITDESGGVRAIWFNQAYLLKTLKPGTRANFAGKIIESKKDLYLNNPAYEITSNHGISSAISGPKHTAGLIPVYPETRGVSSKLLRYILKPILAEIPPIEDFLPQEILFKNNLPSVNSALKKIHFPLKLADAETAKKRFAFEDLFLLQLNNLKNKSQLAEQKSYPIAVDQEYLDKLVAQLPFVLTNSQKEVLAEIVSDIQKPRPMNRLLQGDVGSGKTVVAAIAAILTAKNGQPGQGKQTAILAPTEVLAQQHYRTITRIFSAPHCGAGSASGGKVLSEKEIEILTSSSKQKKNINKRIENGEIKIIIGTHAIIQKTVKFNSLALVIVDEQHRFGVQQRAELVARGQTQNITQTNADNTQIYTENELLYKDLTYKIRGLIFKIRKDVGLGHKEIIYQKVLEEGFKELGLNFEKEKIIDVIYNNKKMGIYRPDFVIENKIIIEIKALPFIGQKEKTQLWTYLKGSNYKLALLINFGNKDVEIKRVIYDMARGPRESASSLRKSAMPHFLSMSATPIPRTLTLTIFGDLDLSIIKELPAGRKPIITKIVAPINREKAYGFIKEQIKKGRQAFVICPRIDSGAQIDTDNKQINAENICENPRLDPRKSVWLEVKSVKEEFEKLSQKIFPELKIAMLHGKMKNAEKENTMKDFLDKKYDILVSTSVVEVGVDAPNAAIMMIEGSDRFGLAQLYQFRGRVGRSEHQSFCFLLTDSESESTQRRLNFLLTAKNGFELAERDLEIRGPGQFLGKEQSGFPDIAMDALKNMELVKAARASAEEIISNDPDFSKHPLLKKHFQEFKTKIHLE